MRRRVEGRGAVWRWYGAVAVGLALAACPPASPPADQDEEPPPADDSLAVDSPAVDSPPPLTAAPPLTAEGWGPLRIGMTREEVVAALGEDANPNAVGGPDPEACDQFRPERAPAGLLVMIERGRLTRISIARDSEVTTDRGFGLGDPAAEIEAAYGPQATTTPHKYLSDPAAYITVWTTEPPGADARGIVYETDQDGRVAHIHAGGPSIQYVEGCL